MSNHSTLSFPSINYNDAGISYVGNSFDDLRDKVELLIKLSYNMYYTNIYNEIINLSQVNTKML